VKFNDRQEQILKYIERNQRIGVNQLSQLFGISIATARRDLDDLANQGKIERTHGGALLIQKAPPELPVYQRQAEQAEEKARIGTAAAHLIKAGDTIFLGCGTTVLEICKHLSQIRDLTVYTNSLLVVNQLVNMPEIQFVVIGGEFRRTEYECHGYFAEKCLSEIFIDKVFFGIHAISLEKGMTNNYLPSLTTDRKVLETGKEIIVLADHTKFNRVSSTLVAPVTIVHKIITDDQTPNDIIHELMQKGIEVIIA
jgi:DeoR/GlpR family transcriptional regulator of sugar metabolism